MPPRIPKKPQTEGSFNFDPDQFLEKWEKGEYGVPKDSNDFQKCIARAFGLRANDSYIYRATAEVTLAQAQTYLNYGGQGRLLEWYRDEEGKQLPSPPQADITAYTLSFSPSTSTTSSLRALSSNAKRASLRASIATHLLSLYSPPTFPIPKLKSPQPNPYLDLWTWTCPALQWAGPDPGTAQTRISHALLPVLYHHFGCVVPSWDALVTILTLAKGRAVLDVGSGNGYWNYMLRRTTVPGVKPAAEVLPIDSGVSEWRTMWVGDTIAADGPEYIRRHRAGGKEDVLLLVYPQVGGEFTSRIIGAYEGDTIVVAGTQNANGFTGFSSETIGEWMGREKKEFEKVCQIPLPSFAGKDEALFAFVKKKS
ncbi:hypothetical protein K461DRAFT_293066 [Myriangium duriaei CBS 260.36]|uniref:Uncharacterized protein n=1 Tax=Myriangium duriaei CBS 260.36 TaxID=1168546 RepID=A0A9P4J2T0_9PEZI|nr:hypothetical protein K461DRAFT_293066 [Myriangium duriaei CBS 260.36]